MTMCPVKAVTYTIPRVTIVIVAPQYKKSGIKVPSQGRRNNNSGIKVSFRNFREEINNLIPSNDSKISLQKLFGKSKFSNGLKIVVHMAISLTSCMTDEEKETLLANIVEIVGRNVRIA